MEFPARCLLLVSVRPLTGSFLTVPIHRLSDSRLIRRSQQGDRDAFAALVQRYDERLRGLTYALVVGEEAMRRKPAPGARPSGGAPVADALAALPAEEGVAVVLVDREGFTRLGAARIL